MPEQITPLSVLYLLLHGAGKAVATVLESWGIKEKSRLASRLLLFLVVRIALVVEGLDIGRFP